MRVIGQWDSLIQLLTTESAQELMGNSHSRLWLRGSAFSILVKNQRMLFLVDCMSFKFIFWASSKKHIRL